MISVTGTGLVYLSYMKTQSGFGTVGIVVVVLALLLVGVGGDYLATSNDQGNVAEGECPIGQPDCNDFMVNGVSPSGGDEASPTEIPGPENLTDSETYQNEEHRFELRYPTNWRIEENFRGPNPSITIWSYPESANESSGFSFEDEIKIDIFVNREDISETLLPDWITEGDILESSDIVIDGQLAKKVLHPGELDDVWDVFFFDQDSKRAASFRYFPSTSLRVGEFDKIVSSFKFIDSADTPDWQTYRNEMYEFELAYPPTWNVTESNVPVDAFFISEGKNSFSILPLGEYDSGLPFSEPLLSTINFGTRTASVNEWELNNGGILIFVTSITDVPDTWSSGGHRLDIQSSSPSDIETVRQILSTFRFIE